MSLWEALVDMGWTVESANRLERSFEYGCAVRYLRMIAAAVVRHGV